MDYTIHTVYIVGDSASQLACRLPCTESQHTVDYVNFGGMSVFTSHALLTYFSVGYKLELKFAILHF